MLTNSGPPGANPIKNRLSPKSVRVSSRPAPAKERGPSPGSPVTGTREREASYPLLTKSGPPGANLTKIDYLQKTLESPASGIEKNKIKQQMRPSNSGQICQSKGLVSTDRSEAAALLSTTPRLRPRSSTNDLAPPHCTWDGYRFGTPGQKYTPAKSRLAVA